jgi:propanediol dehydratase small subunit
MNSAIDLQAVYPVAEKQPERVQTKTGKPLKALTVDAVLAGEIIPEDIRITPAALRLQAAIARAASRDRLAENFERAAELATVPQDRLLAAYEILRPGRASSGDDIRAVAAALRGEFGALRIAVLMDEAASAYERRGLFSKRF